MKQKQNIIRTCVAILIYIILLVLFFSLERKNQNTQTYENCSFRNACVSFCEQQTTEKFTDEYILNKFPFDDFTMLRDFEDENKTADFKVIKQSIECDEIFTKIIVEDQKDFKIYGYGNAVYDYHVAYLDRFCLQPYEEYGKMKVKLEICIFKQPVVRTIRLILLIVTAIILVIPMAVYGCFEEIRSSFHGKLCIGLLISQIYSVCYFAFENHFDLILYTPHVISVFLKIIGIFSSNFIINLMVFDVYLTFKHFHDPDYRSKYFKWFACFLLIFLAISLILAVIFIDISSFEDFYDVMELVLGMIMLMFFMMAGHNIIGFILAFLYLVKLSRSTESKNTRFYLEKERLWLYVQICVIIGITWFVEIIADFMWYSYESVIVGDVVKCYSAAVGAFLLICAPKVYTIIVERYSAIKNEIEI